MFDQTIIKTIEAYRSPGRNTSIETGRCIVYTYIHWFILGGDTQEVWIGCLLCIFYSQSGEAD